LKPTLNFSLELKAKSDEGDGRILLGDNTDGGTVTLRPVRFHCVGSLDFSWNLSYIRVHCI